MLPLALLLARPTFGELWSHNCLKERHVLWENRSYARVSYRRTCLMGGQVFQDISFRMTSLTEYMTCGSLWFIGGHVLWEDVPCKSVIFQDGISYRICLTGGQVLLEVMSYRRACLTERHILQEDRLYWRVCLIGGHVLPKGMSYMWKCPTGDHVL